MSRLLKFLFFITLLAMPALLRAQQPLPLTWPQAQQLFLKNNYTLLTQRYAIDSARAAVITAKLFDNPEFSYENSLYDRSRHTFFPTYRNGGNYTLQLSQLFSVAGRRSKAAALAGIDTVRSVYAYQNTLRLLRHTLAQAYYTLYYKQQTDSIYRQQIESLTRVYTAFNAQYQKGNMAAKDPLRVQAQLLSLQSQSASLQTDIAEAQRDLKIMLGTVSTQYIQPVVPEPAPVNLTDRELAELITSATQNRADVKYAQASISYANQNLALQKALAVPDVKVGVTHSLNGYDPQSYWGLNVDVPIPLFNRNQGNIRAARVGINAAEAQQSFTTTAIAQQLAAAYQTARITNSLSQQYRQNFITAFSKLVNAAEKNYKMGNISLIEFLDYYQAYRDNLKEQNDVLLARQLALENLNYLSGTNHY